MSASFDLSLPRINVSLPRINVGCGALFRA
jgi:hypothetical protein